MGLLDLISNPIDWISQGWNRRVSIGGRGTARLCDSDHILIAYQGEDLSRRRQLVHLDVALELWTRGNVSVSLIADEIEATVDGQMLYQGSGLVGHGFRGITLEGNGVPAKVSFELEAEEGQALRAAEGSVVKLRFHPTRGRRRPRLRIPVVAKRRPQESIRYKPVFRGELDGFG
jgi:hypothetical protein